MYSIRDEKRLWFDGQEQSGMWAGGGKVWSKPAAAVTIADLYGIGPGQVPIHLSPSNVGLNASQQVVSAPNMADNQAGANYNAAKTGTNSIYILDGKFHVPTTAPLLNFANTINLIDARLFMLLNIDLASVGNTVFAGRNSGTGDGQRVNFQWVRASNALRLIRWDGVAGPAIDLSMGAYSPLGTMRLFELHLMPDHATMWMDGHAVSDAPHSFADLFFGRIMAGYSNPTFTGLMGDVIVMRDDGSPAMVEIASTIRRELAAKFDIALP